MEDEVKNKIQEVEIRTQAMLAEQRRGIINHANYRARLGGELKPPAQCRAQSNNDDINVWSYFVDVTTVKLHFGDREHVHQEALSLSRESEEMEALRNALWSEARLREEACVDANSQDDRSSYLGQRNGQLHVLQRS